MAGPELPDFRGPPTRANETWSGDAEVVVCFGDRCLRGRLRAAIRGLNTEPIFTVGFTLADMTTAMPDLVSLTRVYSAGEPSEPAPSALIFTGYVETLGWSGAEATIQASPMVGLKTQRMGGFAVVGVAPAEIFWTLARIGGFAPAEIKIGDTWPPPTEEFFVVAPIDGMELEYPEKVGDVMFTADDGLRRQWEAGSTRQQVTGSEYLDDFRSTKVAAVTTVRANLVFEAEQVGFARIEAAAARFAMASRVSLPLGLDGRPRPFARAQLQERVRVRRIVGVLAKGSKRQWIRGLDTSEDEVMVTAGSLVGVRDAVRAPLGATNAEAIKAWRRAARSSDPASAVVALAEALEFYTAGTSVDGLFSSAEIDTATDAVRKDTDWTHAQERRLKEVLSRINDAPFFIRLLAAVAKDGLSLTKGEADLLRGMRDRRNDLLHGRERQEPPPDELTAAIALVGRLLATRMARLGGAASAATRPGG